MKKLSNKDLLDKIRDKLEKKDSKRCNHIYEIKDKKKILSKLQKNDELYKNNEKIYARCSLKCEGQRVTCDRHIEKESPDISRFIPLDYQTYLSKTEENDDSSISSGSSYDEECILIGIFNGTEYFMSSKEEIISINVKNYGEIVGKKGDILWESLR